MKTINRNKSQRGMTLVELMIALAIGSVILTAMAVLFAVTHKAREELERHSRQIENGRFAIERLRDETRVAGFYGEVLPKDVHFITPVAADFGPSACDPSFAWDNAVSVADATAAGEAVAWQKDHVHAPAAVLGLNNVAAGAPIPCVANAKAGSDVLVLRRAATVETAVESGVADSLYLQNSFCSSDASSFVFAAAPATSQAAVFNLRPRYCGTVPTSPPGLPAQVPLRRMHTTVFFLATCSDCSGAGDGIPTLKRVEYQSGGASLNAANAEVVVEGIESLQIEYGVDSDGDGYPNLPFVTANAVTDWSEVVAIRLFVLSRSLEQRPEYGVDKKSYVLASDGSALPGLPFNDTYRRQLMSTVLQVGNVANWRETN